MSAPNNFTPAELLTSPHLAHAVIAAWINGCPAAGAPFLKPEHFPDDRDKALWSAILELEAQGVSADFTALVERVKRSSTLAQADWPSYCASILGAAQLSSSSSLEANARTIYENYRRLQVYQDHMRRARRAINLTVPLAEDEAAGVKRAKCWSVAELLQTEFSEPRGPWPHVIPVGLTVIGARPKYGKSMLMLQVSAALASGGMLFGQSLEQTRVRYYALEDSTRRLKERLTRLAVPATAQLDFSREIKPLHLGGLAEVEAAAGEYGLIVLDTISRAVPGQDLNREAALYGDLLGRLQTAALNRSMSIVAVVHTRKPNGMDHDPIDDVLGTTQMTAAADCVLALYREQGRTLLKGRARDMEDINLTLEFDPATACWQLVGRTAEVSHTENENEILEALKELGKARAGTVAKVLGKDRSNTHRRLMQLWTARLCKRELIDNEPVYFLEENESPEEDSIG